MKLALSLVAAAVWAASPAAHAQSEAMMRLRAGEWAQARDLAQAALDAPTSPDAEPATRCEWGLHLASAQALLGEPDAARQALAAVDDDCAALPDGHWLGRYGDQVRADLPRLAETAAARAAQALGPPPVPPPPPGADDGWTTADPAALGLDTDALAGHLDACRQSGAAACLVAYRGQIVQEWYGPDYAAPMPTMSSVKSWTGLLAGLLIADGALGLDDPVGRWIPEWTAGAQAGVTVRQLLTMTSGLDTRPEPDRSVDFVADKNAFVFALPLDRPPGSGWAYSNEGVQLLSPILERAAGMPLDAFARERLFVPAEMYGTALATDVGGATNTFADAATTLRDFARIGQLMLQGGVWDGRQVVPADWVAASVRPLPENPLYGLLWWIGEGDGPISAYGTRGFRDTDCWVFPEAEVVVARMQARERPGPAYYDVAVPALLSLARSAARLNGHEASE